MGTLAPAIEHAHRQRGIEQRLAGAGSPERLAMTEAINAPSSTYQVSMRRALEGELEQISRQASTPMSAGQPHVEDGEVRKGQKGQKNTRAYGPLLVVEEERAWSHRSVFPSVRRGGHPMRRDDATR